MDIARWHSSGKYQISACSLSIISRENSRSLMAQRIQDICSKVCYKHLGVICVLVFRQHCAQCLGIIHVLRNFDFSFLVSARHQEKHQTIKRPLKNSISAVRRGGRLTRSALGSFWTRDTWHKQNRRRWRRGGGLTCVQRLLRVTGLLRE